jgi:hypothetical protein
MPSKAIITSIADSKATSNENLFSEEIDFNEKLINTETKGIITGKLKIAVRDAFLEALPDIDDIIVKIKTNETTPKNVLKKNINAL